MKKDTGSAVRLLYAQKWENIKIPTTEDQIVKLVEVAEMVKLFDQGQDKYFYKRLETYYGVFAENGGKNESVIYEFAD